MRTTVKDRHAKAETSVTADRDDELQKFYEQVEEIEVAMMTTRRADGLSVSDHAKLTRDRAKIHELYAPDWKAWFSKGDDPRHGTPDDPRFVLIGVDIHSAVFLEVNKPMPIVLFEVAKGMVTGSTPEVGETHRIGKHG